jgi:3-oxoadipyl-CoA thiolase
MSDAWIAFAARTPIGRYGGALAGVRPDDLAAHVLRHAVDQLALDPETLDEVVLGCANQAGEDNRNVARMALLLAGLPASLPGVTVNRLCGSGMEAVIQAVRMVRLGEADLVLAGGVESMTRAPFVQLKAEKAYARAAEVADTTIGWRFVNPAMEPRRTVSLGETAELVAERHGVSRSDQDAFALRSHERAHAAAQAGVLAREIAPVTVRERGGERVVDADESIRPDTSLERLARLKPVFRTDGDGTVTAGNSSPVNDGASVVLVASDAGLQRLGRAPLARVLASAAAGVEPEVMGLGPIPATRKALERAGLRTGELDLVELNEAFAAQAVACVRELRLDPERVNVNGGAIALGHPLGATGGRLVGTLAHELARRELRYGLATMCIGVGQGLAVALERAA